MNGVHNPSSMDVQINPLNPESTLKAPPPESLREEAHPPQTPYLEDSAVTKAEKFERHGLASEELGVEHPPAKRLKLDVENDEAPAAPNGQVRERQKGVAPIKLE